jgi:TonB family protein
MKFVTGTSKKEYSEPVYKRLLGGLLLSVLFHAALLSLQFGIPGLGLSGLQVPWQEQRDDFPPLAIQIVNTAPLAQPVAVEEQAPPMPLMPEVPAITAQGIRLLAPVLEKTPIPVRVTPSMKKNKALPAQAMAPPRPVPVAAAEPVRVIAQDQQRDDSFVVPLPDPAEPENKTVEKIGQKQEAVLVNVTDQAAQLRAEADNLAELAAAQEKQKLLAQQALAEQALLQRQARELEKQQAELKLKQQQEAILAAQQMQQELAKKSEEDQRLEALRLELEAIKNTEENAKRKAAALALALALEKQQLVQEQAKHALQQEAIREREMKLQQQLRTERQLAVDLAERAKNEEDQRKQEQQQAELRQRQLEEEQAERKKAEALVRQKIVEQKLVEQKAAEQKAAEQKAAEQKAAEQKAAEQRAAEQKAAEQRDRDQALAEAQASSKENSNRTTGDSPGSGDAGTGNVGLPKDLFSSDLANRVRARTRGWDVLSGTPPLPRRITSDDKSRRRHYLGNFEKEVPLRLYVESWRQKIERNGSLNYSQRSKDKARGDPVVLVALRSDGSVEEITIIRSSGRADLDEAARRIIRVNAPYSAFPPNIAAKYDVIEIRRVWNFDETLHLLEESR